ncbi:MAG: RIP metalloprotease RseP, partial [bacterium]
MVLSILVSVVLLSVLIIIHEYGHYLAAKLCKVAVREFSIGFGPALLKKKMGPTLYAMRALPFGGFVRMKGLEEEEPSNDPDSFTSKKAWQRMAIIAAGPFMNLLLGFLLFYVEASAVGVPNTVAVVAEVVLNSPAERAGIRPGDLVVSVNEKPFDAASHMDFSK